MKTINKNTCHYPAGLDNPEKGNSHFTRYSGQARVGQTKKAFTLVELIIVITILAILATIAFVSFQNYTKDARDGNRITTLKNIESGLSLYTIRNNNYPDPDELVEILGTGNILLSKQGIVGNEVVQKIKLNKEARDPKDKTNYIYSITGNGKKYQLGTYLEENKLITYIPQITKTYAIDVNNIDYTNRYFYTIGDKVGILIEDETNQVIIKTQSLTGINLETNTGSFQVYFSNDTQSGSYTSSGIDLIEKIVENQKTTQTIKTPTQQEDEEDTPETPSPTCTEFTYSEWSSCLSGTQTRTITSSTPEGCTGGTTESLSRSCLSCPTGYILVPGNSTFSTQDFCVMKYEAKNVSNVATSQAALTPWVSINQGNAINACNALNNGDGTNKYHLITNNEWMTIARNIESNAVNWEGGEVGTNYIYSGHNDNIPANALAASTDDNDGYNGTGNSSGNQKRTHTLSNGQVIWDLAGNVREHVNGTNNISSPTGEVTNGNACGNTAWNSWNGVNDGVASCSFTNTSPTFYSKTNHGPLGDYNANHGVGRIYSSTSTNRIFLRGGAWAHTTYAGVFSVTLDNDAGTAGTYVGFRCAFSVN